MTTTTASGAAHAPAASPQQALRSFVTTKEGLVATATTVAIVLYLILRFGFGLESWAASWPLVTMVAIGGIPLTIDVIKGAIKAKGGADMLAAIAIISAVLMGEWLVAAIIVLMLSGGEALEEAASARASATLAALARRSPATAYRLLGETLADGHLEIPADNVAVGDRIVVFPHDLCPVDGHVVEGNGAMDESFLTGEPYVVGKSPGSQVISGAVNGEHALVIEASKRAADSRYAQIVGVLRDAEENRPPMRRLADRLGAWYTVIAVALGILGWVISGDPTRFLAVVVIATPCPLLIGVPVAMIGAISLAANRGIIVKNPGMLEQVSKVNTVFFDKTGTLTYGRPVVTEVLTTTGVSEEELLRRAAAVEHYSKHPLAAAIIRASEQLDGDLPQVTAVSEKPGAGLVGTVDGVELSLTNRSRFTGDPALLPPQGPGMETIVLYDGSYAGLLRFRDEPRAEASQFIGHLPGRHGMQRLMILSGDRESEVRHIADQVGISEVHSSLTPEDKLAIVSEHTAVGPTLFLGDGINDAPAMTAATVGVAFGATSDVTTEAADAVVLDSSLERLDDLLHIGARMRRIALQSVLGGMGLSILGMILAVFGLLTPLMGAIAQEVIDILAILNAARVALVREDLHDFDE